MLPDGKHIEVVTESKHGTHSCTFLLSKGIDGGLTGHSNGWDFNASIDTVFVPSSSDANCGYLWKVEWLGDENSTAPRASAFLSAIAALYHAPDGAYEAVIRDENEQISRYRAAAIKPTLPQTAQMYATQANDAVSANEKDKAIALYQKALDAAPWWPTGHYNLALLLGEEADYDDAIDEMKKYLELVPDAPDSQKARQQIWVWQGRGQSSQ